MRKLQSVRISWNDDIDGCMTKVESPNRVLQDFFHIQEWEFVRHVFQAVFDESSIEYQNRGIAFKGDSVILSVDSRETELERSEYMDIFFHLFDLMIVGANDDHHAVRYEPWWQEFTEVSYQLKHKIELRNELQIEGV